MISTSDGVVKQVLSVSGCNRLHLFSFHRLVVDFQKCLVSDCDCYLTVLSSEVSDVMDVLPGSW